MSITLIAVSSELVRSESVNFCRKKVFDIIEIDNDLRTNIKL